MLNLTLWKLKKITLLTFMQGMLAFKGPKAAKSLSQFKGIFPQMITENSVENPNNWPQESKNKIQNSTIVGLIKRGSSGSNKSPVLLETLKSPLLTTVHVINDWSTNKIITLKNIGGETLTRPQKLPTLLVPLIQDLNQEGRFVLLLDILNRLMDNSRCGNQISYNFLHLMVINKCQSFVCMFSHWTEAFPYR